LQPFQEELHEQGYTLLVSSTAYRPDREEEQIRALISRGADGLLLIGYDRAPEIYSYLEQQGVPALIAWAYSPLVERPAIGFDNHASMKLLAQEVIDRGHHRIGVISAVTKGNDRAADRLAGITDALNDNGLSVDDLPVIQTSYGFDNGEAAMKALMSAPNPPTAVMCGNDVLAAGALRGAKALGLEVPRDVSVTGFDDIELARIVTLSLTTVHVPHGEMGTKAASTLIGLVKGNQSIGPVKLQISVKIRKSLGPAPNN
jgi:LacI family transcriptional regulator